MASGKKFLFLGYEEDRAYILQLKPAFGDNTVNVIFHPIATLYEIAQWCRDRGISGVFTTQGPILHKLSGLDKGTPHDYAGSFYHSNGLDWVILPPLKQIFTIKYGQFLIKRYISKLAFPEKWFKETPFSWQILSPTNVVEVTNVLNSCLFQAWDIETFPDPPRIRSLSITGVSSDSLGNFSTHSYVLDFSDPASLIIARNLAASLVPKCFQNGKYDNAYLLAYGILVVNWYLDTLNMYHAWYSELPKDLASITVGNVRTAYNWKDLSDTNDKQQLFLYNCRDTWATANAALAWFIESPPFATSNYLQEFSTIPGCMLCEMTGIKRNFERLEEARAKLIPTENAELASLRKMINSPDFNPSSPKQVVNLLAMLGCADITSSGEAEIEKAKFRHPLNNRILNPILEYRGLRKMRTTYLRTEDDITKTNKKGPKEFKGRILYAINPGGTDSGRLASKEHHFWCGLNIQNQPRDNTVKNTYEADEDFLFGEADLEQAESRDTAYIAGEERLITAVSGERDFHSVNASAFFGLPYTEIYDDIIRKAKRKDVRDLSKRVNHGANYNMQEFMLIQTMGEKAIWEAKRLLKLPRWYGLKQVAAHLLKGYHDTYPGIKGTYYPGVVAEIRSTGRLTSRAIHHTKWDTLGQGAISGWTRVTFGNPEKNKLDLNAYVAHPSQSLNAMTLNRAFNRVYWEVWQPNKKNFKLNTQIHDSILFQFRRGFLHLAHVVKECMEIPVTVAGYDGKTRTFTVPASLKLGKDKQGSRFWGELE